MIDRIQVRNFRALRDVDVPLAPLTVLIGQNDTGKSTFLDAVLTVCNGRPAQRDDGWRHQRLGDTWIRALPQDLRRILPNEWKGRGAVDPGNIRAALPGFFRLPSSGVPMASDGYSDAGPPPPLRSDGGNTAALLDHLLRRDRRRFFGLVDTLKALVPGLEDLEIATPAPESRQVDLVIEGGLRIPADRASTGVRLMVFFVALAYHPSPPEVVLLEEPELGVHPRRLAEVMRLLREMTEGKHGDRVAQIILTTHSPYLLDLVDLERDQVLVFTREDDGRCAARPADQERLRVFLDEFLLGEVWFNQGEVGLLPRAG